jgi:hypothetical protein
MPLTGLFSLVAPQLSRAAGRMWAAEPAVDLYHRWLLVSHDLLRATADLLARAAAECVRREDDLSAVLAPYYAGQLAEEYGHERWVAEDLADAGGDPGWLAGRIPAPAAARLVGAQYYWMRHLHPVALTGHIAMLEWHTPHPELVPELRKRTGLPERAFRTIRRHVALDIEHGKQLGDLFDGTELAPRHRDLVRRSALTTAYGLVEVMQYITEGKD